MSKTAGKEKILRILILANESRSIGNAMRMKTSVGEQCVIEICGAGKVFIRFAHMITHQLNTRHRLAGTFAQFRFWSVID